MKQKFLKTLFFIFYLFIFSFWERERKREWVGEGQRERGTEDLKRALHWQAESSKPDSGLNSKIARSPPEPNSDTQLTEPPRCPSSWKLLKEEVVHVLKTPCASVKSFRNGQPSHTIDLPILNNAIAIPLSSPILMVITLWHHIISQSYFLCLSSASWEYTTSTLMIHQIPILQFLNIFSIYNAHLLIPQHPLP